MGDHLPVKKRSAAWRCEIFLHPGDWVPWVGAVVLGTVVVLATVVVALNAREKVRICDELVSATDTHWQREDEKERLRALHAINFQAL